jgi:Zn-dependent metalloprotease
MASGLSQHGRVRKVDRKGKQFYKREGPGIDTSIRSLRVANAAKRFEQRRLAWSKLPQLAALFGSPSKQRTIYTANHTQRLPGTEVRSEGDDPVLGDDAVNEAYDYLGATFDFYYEAYDRNSIDDAGLPLEGTVHFGVNYDNAFWDGHRMIFGDGDLTVFERFTKSIDVIGHELTHGVVEHEPGLIYWGQSGALNESLADVFGSLVKQYKRKQSAREADWIIGEGLLKPGINGDGIRSMKAPGEAYDDPRLGGKDPQPAHMDDYDRTFEDNGGVHINSGITNHAFYLAADALGGFAWERAGLIWYETMLSPFMGPTTRFSRFARLTMVTARQLFGSGSDEEQAVRDGWKAVGISV